MWVLSPSLVDEIFFFCLLHGFSSLLPRRYLSFVVVVGLVWSNDPETYASSTIATDKKGYIGPLGCGLECEGNNVTYVKKKQLIVEKLNNGCQIDTGKRPGKIIVILLLQRQRQKEVDTEEWVSFINFYGDHLLCHNSN
jgi:hypothetical protein